MMMQCLDIDAEISMASDILIAKTQQKCQCSGQVTGKEFIFGPSISSFYTGFSLELLLYQLASKTETRLILWLYTNMMKVHYQPINM